MGRLGRLLGVTGGLGSGDSYEPDPGLARPPFKIEGGGVLRRFTWGVVDRRVEVGKPVLRARVVEKEGSPGGWGNPQTSSRLTNNFPRLFGGWGGVLVPSQCGLDAAR